MQHPPPYFKQRAYNNNCKLSALNTLHKHILDPPPFLKTWIRPCQHNHHCRVIVSSLRLWPTLLIGSYTLHGMLIIERLIETIVIVWFTVAPDLPTVPLLAGQSRFFTRCPAKSWKCPAFCTKSDFCFERAQFVTLPRCQITQLNVITEIPFDFSQNYQTVGLPRPNRRATMYFGTQLISVGCILLKNLNVGPANRPAFCRQVPLFYAKCPSKNILQVGRYVALSKSCDRIGNSLTGQ